VKIFMMKKKLILVVVLIVSHVAFFIGGDIRGKHLAMNYVATEAQKAEAETALGLYMIYRDIVKNIKNGKSESAICSASLEASEYYDDIKTCLSNNECNSSLIEKVQKIAPEVLNNSSLEFNYLKSKNGIRRCEDKS